MPIQNDILIFLSDQHDGRVMGCAGHPAVQTPNLDRLAARGTMFENAYTPCPLCVPARMSLLSSQLPMHTGVYTNKGSLHPETPTFLHSLALAGYDTVLCGRMHFEGDDQRHGFTCRIAGDITPTAIGPVSDDQMALGALAPTLTEAGCIHMIGGGNSPTLEYDRYVVSRAIDYLSHPHDKPQCVVVGTYGPHFPYIAPESLYSKYLERSTLPPTLELPVDTPYARRLRDTSPEIVRAAQAAYWGMVEFEDQCVGQVHDAWRQWLQENRRQGVFLYLSDHGDHAGDRGFYGKQSLFEAAVRVPMLFEGCSIPTGQRVPEPVSLLDVGPTLCELAGARVVPASDGLSLVEGLCSGHADPDRAVVSEWISNPYGQGTEYGRMIRQGKWKLISYVDYPQEDKLFRPEEDPWELDNLINEHRELADRLKTLAYMGVNCAELVRRKNLRDNGYDLLAAFNRVHGKRNMEMWPVTPEARQIPEHYVSTDFPLPPMFLKYMK